MSAADGDRTRFWPAIERKHGQPIQHWFAVLADLAEGGAARYPEQLAHLMETHGFSRTHANAVVMFHRGSTTSRRSHDLDGHLAGVDATAAATVRAILEGLQARHPGATVEIAWNQPFLRLGDRRLFSVGVLKAHLLASPWSVEVLDAFRPRLTALGLTVNRKTFRLPFDWDVDLDLLDGMVADELRRMHG
jgi:uncharacterized protein YdhG (YjbR/CyaY superfamily)